MEIRVARVVRVAAVVKLIFSHTGGYGNMGSKGSHVQFTIADQQEAQGYKYFSNPNEIQRFINANSESVGCTLSQGIESRRKFQKTKQWQIDQKNIQIYETL